MSKPRVFKKYFNRSLPLYSIQYWYESETRVLTELLDHKIEFDPLFIHKEGRGVSVYYEEGFSPAKLPAVFEMNPEFFASATKDYREIYVKLKNDLSKYDTEDMRLLFDTIVEKIFPVVPIIVNLGQAETLSEHTFKEAAQKLREETETILYEAGIKLYDLIVKKHPEYEAWADYLLMEEVVGGPLPTKEELVRRRKAFIYVGGKLHTGLTSEDLEKQYQIRIEANFSCNSKEIVGQVAQKGIAKGVVRILFSSKDMDKVSIGDIIVAPMTTPNLLPAMKRASAFVTDEGGVTSHAAIAARELGIPCIIGTKDATELLRDGDLVEVDANKGIVRKIAGMDFEKV